MTHDHGKKTALLVLLPFFAGLGLGYSVWGFDRQAMLQEKQELLQKFQTMLEREMDRVETIKDASQDQLTSWVASNRRAQARFTDLLQQMQSLEAEFTDPYWFYVVIAGMVSLASIVILAWTLRHSNQRAIVTIDNVAMLAPKQMMRVCVMEWLRHSSLVRQQLGDPSQEASVDSSAKETQPSRGHLTDSGDASASQEEHCEDEGL